MSPIEGITDRRWLPRLGKIRLGVKKQNATGKEYPVAVDYFVCPPEVQAVYGEKPKKLKIMFPSENPDLVAAQWMKAYSYSIGLICKGDARTCQRKIDVDTGESFVNKETKRWEMTQMECDPEHCEKIGSKQCRRVMTLIFCLPDVPGLGIWQLDTSSYYSIMNINSQIGRDPPGFIRCATNPRDPVHGWISWIPLTLSVGPQEVNPPGEGRKTVHVISLKSEETLGKLIATAGKSLKQILLASPDENDAPDDLFPTEIIGGPTEDENVQPEAVQQPVEHVEQKTGDIAGKSRVIEAVQQEIPTTPVEPRPTETVQQPVEQRQKAVPGCRCKKPVPAGEVVEANYSFYHTICKGYLCTPPFDCFPGCPHIPVTTEENLKEPVNTDINRTKPVKTGWDKVTREQVADYFSLEKIFCQLMPGKSTRDMYRALGIESRAYATITAWDAFLTLKELAKEPPE
jgi:hypothetical protein